MRLSTIPFYRILIIICLLCIFVLIFISAVSGESRAAETTTPVRIVGVYSIAGSEAQKLTENTKIDSNELNTITILGRFSTDIPQGWVLMLRIDNIRVMIKINGKEVFSFGGEETTPSFSKTAGNTWGYYISPGISESDTVEVVLENVYNGRVSNVFEEFLNHMSFGHGYELYDTMLRETMPSMLFGFVFFIIGIIVLIICIVAKLFKTPGMERGMALSFVTITGGLWIFFDGGFPYATLLFKNPFFYNTIDVMQIFIIPAAMILLVYKCLESNNAKRIAKLLTVVSLIYLLGALLSQISGKHDLYEIQNQAVILCVIIAISSIILLGYEALALKKRQALLTLLSWLPLILSGIMEAANYIFGFMPERAAVKYGFALSVLLQFIQLVYLIRASTKRAQKTMQLEYELLQSRIAVMLSQIQPHFLFNTLNDIRFLYRESPERAEEALVSFTRYLRGNMDSLNQLELIPFSKELDHLKNYTAIEQIRFGERLKIVFALECTEFYLPVLTVQPLVENAIRHGVSKKREGGTVVIRTYEDEQSYTIEVLDDGVGFDPLSPKDDDDSHNGTENVRSRLRSMCGGSLEIISRIGSGTSVLVHIPKEMQK